ncbi:hypothetical protein [Aridibaculum aurantiacum]|uniref:hypothetical protein n=1 Tax=Aridibaculum aurantiacum TaxID=2810307 RepID=UPI001A97C4F0|nr:hypothetical protein [Aridibaculum aurantiacum]
MDPEVREFFKRIGYSIGISFLWLAIICIAAIKGDNAFIEQRVTLGNIFFYSWCVISVFLLIYFLRKLWRKQQEF